MGSSPVGDGGLEGGQGGRGWLVAMLGVVGDQGMGDVNQE